MGLITARSGVKVSGGDIVIGSAATLSQDNIFTTGIITATSFSVNGIDIGRGLAAVATNTGCW